MQQSRRYPPISASPVAVNNNPNRHMRSVNRSMSSTSNQCSGCSQPIFNSLVSNVLDRVWHPECVRCIVCRCLLNEQCYSREGKLYCKDDFIKKYIHRCFSCQNLIQSHDFIRRVRLGRIYHADCFVCGKCKRVLHDEDINAIWPSDGSTLNDTDYLCQICVNPMNKLVKPSMGTNSSLTADEDETTDSEFSNAINGKALPIGKQVSTVSTTNASSIISTQSSTLPSLDQQTSRQSIASTVESQVNQEQADEFSTPPPEIPDELEINSPPTKAAGRQTKTRQNSSTATNNKRSTAKSKAVARQKQTTTNERKGRPPATRSKSSAAVATTAPPVQTRSSNRRNTKTSRYRKRTFSSGSDEDDSEDEDEEEDEEEEEEGDDDDDDEGDADFNGQENEREGSRSQTTKTKASKTNNENKTECEQTNAKVSPTILASTASEPIISESMSLLSGRSGNPISVSSIIQPDIPPSFLPPNFNPAFPTPQQFLPPNHSFPPGFPLQPRMPMPPPMNISQSQPASISDTQRSSHSTNAPETDLAGQTSSPSKMDVPTNAESGAPVHPTATPPKISALSSLLEFGSLPPSNIGDIRPTGAPTNPYPFPFVTPGPGVPFSPQAAAGMTTYYRPPHPPVSDQPPTKAPLDVTSQTSTTTVSPSQTTSKPPPKKKSPAKRKSTDVVSQNILDEQESPPKKARKVTPRGKGKNKKNETDGENDTAEDKTPSSPALAATASQPSKKKRKLKKDGAKDSTITNDNDAMQLNKVTTAPASHNLLTQMGLVNNSFVPPTVPSPLQPSSSTNGTAPTPTAQQQAQIAAMYNMTPHFGAYNTFPNAFNPAFPGAPYPGGYPPPYGFHPAFGTSAPGQPFPFMPPTSTSSSGPITTSTSDDKTAPIVVPETKPSKSKAKSKTPGEKKKPVTPRTTKKKSTETVTVSATTSAIPTEKDEASSAPSTDPTVTATTVLDATSAPSTVASKRRISGTESEDFDEQADEQQQQSQTANGKSGNESDASTGAADRSSMNAPSSNSTSEKKGGRTTIKPQQLEILNKAFESCAKPNKSQREQIATDTGLNIRVIQVWFQNKRSKERKGKVSKEKDTPLDDDEAGDDSPPASSPTAPAPTSAAESDPSEPATVLTSSEPESQI
ncbi:unnamed protein product [Adineta ricciae]|uniref:Uncharacterized protein n=1 Tax=Adineta ricciae TaxID=249248 RepID=A0A814T568_ADIRI|nr:unnamed protein product [Adineta ricciae]